MKRVLRALVPASAALLVLLSANSTSVVAQEPAAEPGPLFAIGEDMWRASSGSCWQCHGNMGNGRPEMRDRPAGSDFRRTTLTVEQIAEVIRCGRPGTGMPFFGRNAYEGDNRCFGVTREELGNQAPAIGIPPMQARQIDALAQFIAYQFVGRGPATEEECLEFFGANASSCNRWPTRAELEAEGD
ncbi:MAG: hypothetical protein KIS96_14865 [Bauldia sp.]|nr:hypothetical protein [Bauldia sp.]